jgi:methyltransferase (TIGR00027 family)
MKPARASATASMVSIARGVGVSAELRDPMAHVLSTGKLTRTVASFERKTRAIEAARFVIRALSLGLVDHNTLRMLLVDRALEGWLQAGTRQVVLLGAGLDSRGWRMHELAACDLFEVDHPDTQAFKRQQVSPLSPRARHVAFVPVDFEHGDLVSALAAAGHRPELPTAWVCEGVIAYLPPATTERLLREVGVCSAPGSHLALSYVTPPRGRGVVSKAVAALLVRQLGERARGFVSRDAMYERLKAAGLTPLEDTGWSEWLERFPEYEPLPNVFKERLVIARRA